MLGKSLRGSPVFTSGHYHISPLDIIAPAPNVAVFKLKASHCITHSFKLRSPWLPLTASKNWRIRSSLNDEETEERMWEACREALIAFEFNNEEKDKILGKAFGHVHSPYWGEEREKQVPKQELVNEILDYLRDLGLSNEDLGKLLKKFPEVLGCSLDEELRKNVVVLADTWGIKGKTLRSLLLRNPKVLGYNVDCKGDCIAQCTRCWVRF